MEINIFEWILIDDVKRRPLLNENVIVKDKDNTYYGATYNPSFKPQSMSYLIQDGFISNFCMCCDFEPSITHWMRLSNPRTISK